MSSGWGGAFLFFGLIILFIVYVIVMIIITYWYIVIPAIALIIIYKKRKSIWKPKDTTFLNDEVRHAYYHGTSQDPLRRKYYSSGEEELLTGRSTWHERDEGVRQQNAEDERRRREFWENFWKQYESEFRQKSDQKALDDETVEDRRKRGDENFEDAWEEYKDKFEEDEDENYAKYYLLLGLKQSATYDELRQRFRELALKYHPDKNKTKKIQAAKKFIKILEAYEKIIERMKVNV